MTDIQLKNTWQDFFRGELRNWHPAELAFMAFALIGVVAATVVTGGDSFMGVASAATGIMYTLLAGKGKSSCYLFGIANSFLYGLIAMQSRIYGDMLLNWAYYLPMQFVGLWAWSRNYDSQKGEVRKKTLSAANRVLFVLLLLLGWSVFALVLERFNARIPWLDSATTVLSIAAMVLSVMRRFEQWICWTCVNGISIFMWYQVYTASGGSLATLLMWVIFFICGLVFAWQWHNSARQEEK